jgi:hypothetical protein
MASPHIAGLVSAILAFDNTLKTEDIRSLFAQKNFAVTP